MEISFNNDSVFLDIDSLSFRNNKTAIDISAYLYDGGRNLLNIKSNTTGGTCIIATDNFRLNSLAGIGYDGSYVQIDQYGNLKPSDSNLKIFDVSFHRLYLRQQEISANQFVNALHMTDIDASYTDISTSFIQVKQMLNSFDNSVVNVNSNIEFFDASMAGITISFEKVDTSLNFIHEYTIDTSNSLDKLRNIDLSYILIAGAAYNFPKNVDNTSDNNILVANHDDKSFEWNSYRILDGDNDLSLNNLSINTNLNVTGKTELSNNVFIFGNMDMVGDISLSGGLDMVGDISLSGGLDMVGDISLSGGLDMVGDISLSGGLDMVGDISLSGELNVNYSISADSLILRGVDVSISYIHDMLTDLSGKQSSFFGTKNETLDDITNNIDSNDKDITELKTDVTSLQNNGASNVKIAGSQYGFDNNTPQYNGATPVGETFKILRYNGDEGNRKLVWVNYRVLDGSHDLSINHLDIYNGFNTNGQVNITGNTEISGNVNTYGISDFSGDVIIHDGIINISGDTTIIGKTDLSGSVCISQNLDIYNNLSIEELTSTQNFKLNSVEMLGHSTFNGAYNVIEYESASISNLEFKGPDTSGDISGAIKTPNGTKIRFL